MTYSKKIISLIVVIFIWIGIPFLIGSLWLIIITWVPAMMAFAYLQNIPTTIRIGKTIIFTTKD